MEKEPEALVKRVQDLEASEARLREQLEVVRRQREVEPERRVRRTTTGGGGEAGYLPDLFASNPYRNVLHCMGHALHVCRPDTGEIIYWNRSAENLYGWKDCEAIGRRVTDLLFDEESLPYLHKATERLSDGQSWSGQFPLKKRSGEMFVALVTQSPMYEDGEFIGIITVSSDAAPLYDTYLEKSRVCWDQAQGQPGECKSSFRRIQWQPQAQIASSVSSLASKIFPSAHVHSVNEGRNSPEICECMLENQNVKSEKTEIPALKAIFRSHAGKRAVEEMTHKYEETVSKFNQPSKTVAKVFGKLNIRESIYQFQKSDKGIQTNLAKNSASNSTKKKTESHQPTAVGDLTGSSGSNRHASKGRSANLDVPAKPSLRLILANNK